MILPGFGHAYLREWLRAVLWFGLILSASSLLVPVSSTAEPATIQAAFQASMTAVENAPWENKVALLAIVSLSMADAYWMATRGNRQAAAGEGFSCPRCGKEIDDDLDFCHWCTIRLEPRE